MFSYRQIIVILNKIDTTRTDFIRYYVLTRTYTGKSSFKIIFITKTFHYDRSKDEFIGVNPFSIIALSLLSFLVAILLTFIS